MRKVAGYSFEQSAISQNDAQTRAAAACAAVDAWLLEKGTHESEVFIFRDGRQGRYAKNVYAVEGAHLIEHLLHEPTETGPVQTDIKIGSVGNRVLAYVELKAGTPTNWVGPVTFEIRCPRVVRTILNDSSDWKLGECPLSTRPIDFSGAAAADRLNAVIWHPDRNLPVVCISEDDEGPLTNELAAKLAEDLSGLAIVAVIDSEVSWSITNIRGKEWSCFNGAIRLYWPRTKGSNPLHHPLWTKFQLLRDAGSPEDASRKIRRQLRRRILGLSAFSVNEPNELRQIRDKNAAQVAKIERAKLQDNADWEKLANNYASANDSLTEKLRQSELEIDDLRFQLSNYQGALQWRDTSEAEVAPKQELPPATVGEAVDRARKLSSVLFGDDVPAGVSTLSPDAGPPDKLLDYFEALQMMAEAQAKGPLGITQIQWLKDHGFHASGESETILNSEREMRKRSWAGLNGKQTFEKHLKPNDSVSPDKCVRVYFDFDQESKCVIVGWVGRHPE